jgi:lipopolysaccharide/colanic/teichoic acid biosynthesis glycosyltransferase
MSTSSSLTSSVDENESIGRLAELLTDMSESDRTISTKHRWYLVFKNAGDMLLGLALLIVTAPFIALAALLVKLTSHGPAFYSQTRMGKDGRLFRLFKLRTMVHHAEALSGPVWAEKNDPRVTPFGRFLRDTHLDEFPQLINVICGQMSLVGPRPERPEFVADLEWDLPHYRTRLKLRPGITGLTQLLLPPDTDIESVRRKLVFDMYYVRSVSPWLDLRILCATTWYLAKTFGSYLWKLVSLPTPKLVEQSLFTESDGRVLRTAIEQTDDPLTT